MDTGNQIGLFKTIGSNLSYKALTVETLVK